MTRHRSFTLLEDNAQYSSRVRDLVSRYFASNVPLVTSPLTFAEYCVVPYRQNELRKIKDFEAFICDAKITISSLTIDVAKRAAQIRAKYSGIKAMDALQLASAIISGCDVFLTNDKQLRQVDEIQVLLVDDL